MSDDLPPFVIVGEWKDENWDALSRRLTTALTAGQLAKVIAGPRRHPYGVEAYQVIRDSQVVIYPNKASAEALEEAVNE